MSRDPALAMPGAIVAPDLDAALQTARADAPRRGAGEIMVVGGADIFAQTMAVADRLLITRVHLRPSGDTGFPAIDPAVWAERQRTEHRAAPGDEADFTVLVYHRHTGR
jgi:dihydrofolate reductase